MLVIFNLFVLKIKSSTVSNVETTKQPYEVQSVFKAESEACISAIESNIEAIKSNLDSINKKKDGSLKEFKRIKGCESKNLKDLLDSYSLWITTNVETIRLKVFDFLKLVQTSPIAQGQEFLSKSSHDKFQTLIIDIQNYNQKAINSLNEIENVVVESIETNPRTENVNQIKELSKKLIKKLNNANFGFLQIQRYFERNRYLFVSAKQVESKVNDRKEDQNIPKR